MTTHPALPQTVCEFVFENGLPCHAIETHVVHRGRWMGPEPNHEYTPVRVMAVEQNREDQLLGAAWRRCEAALPVAWEMRIEGRTGFVTVHAINLRDATDFVFESGDTPTLALDALTAALQAHTDADR